MIDLIAISLSILAIIISVYFSTNNLKPYLVFSAEIKREKNKEFILSISNYGNGTAVISDFYIDFDNKLIHHSNRDEFYTIIHRRINEICKSKGIDPRNVFTGLTTIVPKESAIQKDKSLEIIRITELDKEDYEKILMGIQIKIWYHSILPFPKFKTKREFKVSKN